MEVSPDNPYTPGGILGDQDESIDDSAQLDSPAAESSSAQSSLHLPDVRTKTARPRGRAPRDPLAVIVRFDVLSLEDLEATLRDYLKDPTAPAEHATIVFVFPVSSAFMIYTKPLTRLHEAPLYGTLNKVAISVMEALRPTMDPKEQVDKQRSIGKVCVEAVMAADGYKYQFNNNWVSKEDDASRFSYFCNDSPLNKGRTINEGARTVGKRKTKETYECGGMIHVKFSRRNNNLEVHYRHIPVHTTYTERAPPPRKDSKRLKLMEVFHPELIPKKRARVPKPPKPPKIPKLLKQKDGTRRAPSNNEVDLSQDDNGLQTLIDCLDGESVEGGDAGGSRPTPPPFPPEKLAQMRLAKQARVIPGTMQGSLREGGDIVWRTKNGKALPSPPPPPPPLEPLSEMDALKLKLQEAEDRIKRLEASTIPPPGAHLPPPYPYPPPHPGQQYPPPYQNPYHYPYAPPGYPPYPPPPGQWAPRPPPHPPPLSPLSSTGKGKGKCSAAPASAGPKQSPFTVHQWSAPGSETPESSQTKKWITYTPPGRVGPLGPDPRSVTGPEVVSGVAPGMVAGPGTPNTNGPPVPTETRGEGPRVTEVTTTDAPSGEVTNTNTSTSEATNTTPAGENLLHGIAGTVAAAAEEVDGDDASSAPTSVSHPPGEKECHGGHTTGPGRDEEPKEGEKEGHGGGNTSHQETAGGEEGQRAEESGENAGRATTEDESPASDEYEMAEESPPDAGDTPSTEQTGS